MSEDKEKTEQVRPKAARSNMRKRGLGQIVVVRDDMAGVHFGTLVDYDVATDSAVVADARRLWSWQGPLSVHGVAAYGCDADSPETKCDAIVPMVVSCHVAEIVWCTAEGAAALARLPVWRKP